MENGIYTKDGLKAQIGENKVAIYYNGNGWNNAYIHYKIGNGSWTNAPGVPMTNASNGYYLAVIDLGNSNTLTACFNNGSNTWDNNYGNNYVFTGAGSYTVNNNTISSGEPH